MPKGCHPLPTIPSTPRQRVRRTTHCNDEGISTDTATIVHFDTNGFVICDQQSMNLCPEDNIDTSLTNDCLHHLDHILGISRRLRENPAIRASVNFQPFVGQQLQVVIICKNAKGIAEKVRFIMSKLVANIVHGTRMAEVAFTTA